MLNAVPDSWFSWNFKILDHGNAIAKIDLAWAREAGKLYLDGRDYKFYRENLFTGAFVLEKDGKELARAEKPNALFRSFEVRYNGRKFTLKAQSTLTRAFALQEVGQTIGSIRPENAFIRRAVIDLPEEIELPVRIFMAWLTFILWKRDAESATQ